MFLAGTLAKVVALTALCSAFLSAAAQNFDANEYVTGMILVGSPGADPVSCPPMVWFVAPDTPAADAAVHPGDRLIAINGYRGLDIVQARPYLHSKDPTPLNVELEGDHGKYSVTLKRIQAGVLYDRQGWKVGPDGDLYPKDASNAEMQRVSKITSEPPRNQIVFPGSHYPKNPDLYYPGFEVFVWNPPQRMAVGGIVEKGPAREAGVHYGDEILSVNGVDPAGKSISELEKLFSSEKPSSMTLVINRDGETKTFKFDLAKARDIAAENHRKYYDGRVVPSVVTEANLHCFSPSKPDSGLPR